jgi:hypothetical protein
LIRKLRTNKREEKAQAKKDVLPDWSESAFPHSLTLLGEHETPVQDLTSNGDYGSGDSRLWYEDKPTDDPLEECLQFWLNPACSLLFE